MRLSNLTNYKAITKYKFFENRKLRLKDFEREVSLINVSVV